MQVGQLNLEVDVGAPLHLTRIAFGCPDLATLEVGLAARAQGGEVFFTTRNRPRRAAELIGGYLHFIIRHTLVARVQILRFDESADGRTDIVCAAQVEPVRPTPRRAHQGWRYLTGEDAPPPFGDADGLAEMSPELLKELSALALL